MKKTLLVILIMSLSLWCLLGAIETNTFNINFYMKSYDKYNIQEVTGKSNDELQSITKDLFIYLRDSGGKEVLEPNFNEREILHMEDVKGLFKIGFKLKYIAIFLSGFSITILIILWKRKKEKFIKYLVIGLFINWLILGILFLMIYFDFSKYFILFHHMLFSNDLWLLNSRTDLLIQMLPEEFFIALTTKIVIFFISFVSIIQFIGYIIMKKEKYQFKKDKTYKEKSLCEK